MSEVLIAVDDDDDRAGAMARTLTGLPVDPSAVTATITHVFTDNPEGIAIHKVQSVRTLRDHLEDAGFEVELVELSGEPSHEILSLAERRDVDLLCLAGRKRSATGKVIFGSVTQDVILGTDRPVLVADSAIEGGRDG